MNRIAGAVVGVRMFGVTPAFERRFIIFAIWSDPHRDNETGSVELASKEYHWNRTYYTCKLPIARQSALVNQVLEIIHAHPTHTRTTLGECGNTTRPVTG
eukprot:1675210-Amphidinium_carterae.2